MATRAKESPRTKEKRGTSPSPFNIDTTHRRKSPSTSKQPSPAKRHDSISPTTRQVPNYLRPTISSGLDPSKQNVKKHGPGDTTQKSTISRRRSLEKSLPPSPSSKARASPNPGERILRSSSLNAKGTTSQKSLSGNLPKVRPVSVKKSGTVKKQESETNSALPTKELTITSPVDKVDTSDADDSPQVDSEEDQDSSVTQVHEDQLLDGTENIIEMAAEVLLVEDNEEMNLTHSELESHHEAEEVVIVESSMVSKGQDDSIGSIIEKQEEKVEPVEETGENHSDLKENRETETDETKNHAVENVDSEVKAEVEENKGEGSKEDSKEATWDKKEEGKGSNGVSLQETENAKEEAKEVKQHGENAAVKQQVVLGRNDSVVSNDVIEETASKLREQRKNKVKALAGAFETVIHLQDPK